MAKNWYFLQVRTNYEKKVKELIAKTVSNENPVEVGEIKVPEEEYMDYKSGKKKVAKRKLYPGDVLIEMDLPEEAPQWKPIITAISKVTGVVGFVGVPRGDKPMPIPAGEVKQILTKMGEIKGVEPTLEQYEFQIGDKVKVIEGPFNEFEGTIEDINFDKGKLKVTVEIFGRKAPVEIGFSQVVRLS